MKNRIIKLTRRSTALLLAIIIWGASANASAYAQVDIYVSDEVGASETDAAAKADILDDQWLDAASSTSSNCQDCLIKGSIAAADENPGKASEIVIDKEGLVVNVKLKDYQVDNNQDIGEVATTQGNVSDSATLQDGSPKPESLSDQLSWSEVSGGRASLNGVEFEFSQPVAAFGAWFGDVETRTDGEGQPAKVRLFDQNGNKIGEDYIIQPSTNQQELCGSPNLLGNNFEGCGNKTTRFIGFVANDGEFVKLFSVIVGDDDTSKIVSQTSASGTTEHLSFIGPRVYLASQDITEPINPVDPEPTISEPEDISDEQDNFDQVVTAEATEQPQVLAADQIISQEHHQELATTNDQTLAVTGGPVQLSFTIASLLIMVVISLSLLPSNRNLKQRR